MIPAFPDAVLDSMSHTLGDAGEPLIGRVLTHILEASNIPDTSGESTKWKRLYHSFKDVQQQRRSGNNVGDFLQSALDPARWTAAGARERYDSVRADVNRALVMAGLEIAPNGKLRTVRQASSLGEAHERSNRLRARLEGRQVHPAVLAACHQLVLKDDNFFHAAFEVTKSVADRLRQISGSNLDGSRLVDEVLEVGQRAFPLVAINRYDTESLRNDQKGIALLARGLFLAFRNVTAHEPAATWQISELDALDMISTASLIHRRLDAAVLTSGFNRSTV